MGALFEPVRKIGNKIWLTKHVEVYILITWWFSRTNSKAEDVILKKPKTCCLKRRHVSGFMQVWLFHDTPSHISELACDCFLFPKLINVLILVVFKISWQVMAQLSEDYLNQQTMTHLKNGFKDWNNVFQTTENTFIECNVHFTILVERFWVAVQYTLHIEQSRITQHVLLKRFCRYCIFKYNLYIRNFIMVLHLCTYHLCTVRLMLKRSG